MTQYQILRNAEEWLTLSIHVHLSIVHASITTGEREADPRLAELVGKVVGRVDQVCNLLKTCSFTNTTKGDIVTLK